MTTHLPPIVGISGKYGSGKTTFSSYFLTRHPQYCKKSFAECLKHVVCFMTKTDIEFCRTKEGKDTFFPKWGHTFGELLQKIGTEGIRCVLPDAWVISLFEEFDENSLWIIDDVRFPNEADAIRKVGGIVVRFEGDPGDIYEELCQTRDPLHLSETAMDNYEHFHCVIKTEDFVNQLDRLYDKIFHPNKPCGLEGLRFLCLQGVTEITDAHLQNLTDLTSLDLSYNCEITDCGLVNLTNLTSLNLSCQRSITDRGLANLTNLTELNLDRNTNITTDALNSLPKLKYVYVKHNQPIVKKYKKTDHYKICLV